MGAVVVVGSINMDLVVRVPHLPGPGDTVLGDRLVTIPGGKGANQAVAAARLGGHVRMIGRVGGDAFGAELLAGLKEDGVDTSGVAIDPTQPSGVALIVVDSRGQNTVTVAPGANSTVGDYELSRLKGGLRPDDVVVLQLEIPLGAVSGAIEIARSAGAKVVLNAAPSAALEGKPTPHVDLLIVNESEARDLGGVERLGSPGALAVTLGEAGSVLYENGRMTRIEPRSVEAVDSTAAGDAFIGAAAFAIARGSSTLEAVQLGGAAGAAAATKLGARPSLPRVDDLRRLFEIDLG